MKWRNIIVRIECFIALVLRKCGYRKSISPIPDETPYCYLPDHERTEANKGKDEILTFYIKPCKYYRWMEGELNSGCTFVGFAGFSLMLGDQCKVCGIKED